MPIEVNVIEHAKRVPATVHRPDGTSYETRVRRTEEPGKWFHPVIGTWVSGAGRLLLALVMRLVTDAGGHWCFCDTDSLFVIATHDGNPENDLPTLTHQAVRGIVARFETLNPYDRSVIPGSILKIETPIDNDPVYAFSVASKRYALYRLDANGHPVILRIDGSPKRSEHGLGHLLPPSPTNIETSDWIDQLWRYLISGHLDLDPESPDWFGQPAFGRLAVGSPQEERAFRQFNKRRPYLHRVRPFNFASTCRPEALERSKTGLNTLVAPREADAKKRIGQAWFNRHDPTGTQYRVRVGNAEYVIPDRILIETYGEYFREYASHPEAKAADQNGNPCRPWTTGLLQPRTVTATGLIRIGKEANRLAEDPSVIDTPGNRAVDYPEPVCTACGTPLVGRQRDWSEACRKRFERQNARNESDRRAA